MMNRFEDKVIIVTGARSGIGAGTARRKLSRELPAIRYFSVERADVGYTLRCSRRRFHRADPGLASTI
jgi:NAD(P)-dependent dehydrogenase (short-subunit alcohol dehydrogenase family)